MLATRNKNQKGFTLLELLLYMTFFTFLIVTVMSVMYQNIEGANRINEHIQIQQEGNFLLRKISWALTGVNTVSVSPAILTINKFAYVNNPIVFNFNGITNKITIEEANSGIVKDLNSDNVMVSLPVSGDLFTDLGGSPKGVKINFNLSSTNGAVQNEIFTITKYLRK